MIKAIIFDFSGVIMSEGDGPIFEKHSLKKGFEPDLIKKLVKKYYSGAHEGKYKDFADFFAKTKPDTKITVADLEEAMNEVHSSKKINKSVIGLIKKLKNSYKIAMLTNFSSDLNKFLKDIFAIYDLFDVVVNSYDIKVKKPNLRAYLDVLGKLNLKGDEVVFIDG